MAAQPIIWSGCYGGITAGGVVEGTSSKNNSVNVFGSLHAAQSSDTTFDGPVGGVDFGCNVQPFEGPLFSRILFGPELEGWVQDVSGTSDMPNLLSPGETIRSAVKSTWGAAASLRIGYTVGNFLVYGKGGATSTRFKYNGYIFNNASGATVDEFGNSRRTSIGYLVGAGAEMAISQHWSAKLEYDYLDYGNLNTTYRISLDPGLPSALVLTGPSTSHEHEQLLKTSLVYRF